MRGRERVHSPFLSRTGHFIQGLFTFPKFGPSDYAESTLHSCSLLVCMYIRSESRGHSHPMAKVIKYVNKLTPPNCSLSVLEGEREREREREREIGFHSLSLSFCFLSRERAKSEASIFRSSECIRALDKMDRLFRGWLRLARCLLSLFCDTFAAAQSSTLPLPFPS